MSLPESCAARRATHVDAPAPTWLIRRGVRVRKGVQEIGLDGSVTHRTVRSAGFLLHIKRWRNGCDLRRTDFPKPVELLLDIRTCDSDK